MYFLEILIVFTFCIDIAGIESGLTTEMQNLYRNSLHKILFEEGTRLTVPNQQQTITGQLWENIPSGTAIVNINNVPANIIDPDKKYFLIM